MDADMARNTLRQTQHEPMNRLLLVEEAWPRKFNLPDEYWSRRYIEPKDKKSYFQIRRVTTPEGQLLQERPTWLARASQDCLMNNPRLRREVAAGREFYAVNPTPRREVVTPTSYELPVEE